MLLATSVGPAYLRGAAGRQRRPPLTRAGRRLASRPPGCPHERSAAAAFKWVDGAVEAEIDKLQVDVACLQERGKFADDIATVKTGQTKHDITMSSILESLKKLTTGETPYQKAQKIMMQAQNAKIEELEKNFDTKIEELEKNFDTKFEEVNSKISKVETTVQELKNWKTQLLAGFLGLGALVGICIGWYTFFGPSS